MGQGEQGLKILDGIPFQLDGFEARKLLDAVEGLNTRVGTIQADKLVWMAHGLATYVLVNTGL